MSQAADQEARTKQDIYGVFNLSDLEKMLKEHRKKLEKTWDLEHVTKYSCVVLKFSSVIDKNNNLQLDIKEVL